MKEIKRIVREYSEQLYSKKLYNLNETDQFLKTQTTKIDSRKKKIQTDLTGKKSDSVTKNLTRKNIPRPGDFTGEFYQYLEEELTQIFNFFPKYRRGENTSYLILWGQHYPGSKARQRHQKKSKLSNILSW